MTQLKDLTENKDVPVGAMVDLTDGKKFLLSAEDGGRVVIVTLANR